MPAILTANGCTCPALLSAASAILLQGCFSWQHTQSLGAAKVSNAEAVAISIKVPENQVGIRLFSRVYLAPGSTYTSPENLAVSLENMENRSIGVATLDRGLAYVKTHNVIQIDARRQENGDYHICSFDTSKGALRLTITVRGAPAGSKISILGLSSDSL
jgi:hypothetical protein